jgi:tol-pal system protein YbgF
MRFLRVGALALTFSSFLFAVNKDLLALQRELDARLDAMQQQQQQLSSKLDVLTGMLNQMSADTRHTADQVAGMQDVLRNTVTNSLGPVNSLGTKVEATGEDVRSLRDALADLASRLERMDAKITDLTRQMQIMQNPPSAPGAQGTTGPPGAVGAAGGQSGTPNSGTPNQSGPPPVGVSAAQLFTDARRDQQTGNTQLAVQEYQQYLSYFPNTEYAASAQYYLGEIAYTQGDYKTAIPYFDAVLERYPQNPRTKDAAYMKGMALAKSGQRTQAVQELRALIQKYPGSEQARKAQVALADRSLFPSATAGRTRRP